MRKTNTGQTHYNRELFKAIKRNDFYHAKDALVNGANPGAFDSKNKNIYDHLINSKTDRFKKSKKNVSDALKTIFTITKYAVSRDVDTVIVLLDMAEDWELNRSSLTYALNQALKSITKPEKLKQICELLLKAGADPNLSLDGRKTAYETVTLFSSISPNSRELKQVFDPYVQEIDANNLQEVISELNTTQQALEIVQRSHYGKDVEIKENRSPLLEDLGKTNKTPPKKQKKPNNTETTAKKGKKEKSKRRRSI